MPTLLHAGFFDYLAALTASNQKVSERVKLVKSQQCQTTSYPSQKIFVLFVRNLLYNLMASPSMETDTLNGLNLTEHHSETETDEQSEETIDSVQQGVQLISKKNTKSLVWNYFGFTPDEDGRPTNCCNSKCKLCFKDVSAKFGNTSNLLKHLHLHHRNEFSEISHA